MTAFRALQTLKLFNLELSNFQTLKLSSSKLGGLSNFPSRRVSNLQTLQTFNLSNSQTRELSSLSNFRSLKNSNLRAGNLAKFETFELSNSRPQPQAADRI